MFINHWNGGGVCGNLHIEQYDISLVSLYSELYYFKVLSNMATKLVSLYSELYYSNVLSNMATKFCVCAKCSVFIYNTKNANERNLKVIAIIEQQIS